eukprot:403363966
MEGNNQGLNALPSQVETIIQEFNDKNQSYENLENLETDAAFQKLIGSIGESYERDRFSMKFKDITLEQEYIETYQEKIRSYGLIYTIEGLIIFAEYLIFQSVRLVLLNYNYPAYKWTVVLTVAFCTQLVLHYLLSRKYKFFATQFTNFQSIAIFVAMIEAMILGNPTQASVDGFILIPGILVSAAFASYDQRTVLVSYICIMIYSLVRTLKWINDDFRYARFNIFVVTALGIVYTFARFSQNRDREKFEQVKNQKQLLRLFHNLIKVYHDGILITQNEEIVYNNKAVENIFNINNKKEHVDLEGQNHDQDHNQQLNPLNSDRSLVSQENQDIHSGNQLRQNMNISDNNNASSKQIEINKKIKDAFLKTKPKKQKLFSNTSISEVDIQSERSNFSDLWDYIQKNQLYLDPRRFNKEYLLNPLDGIYFKVKSLYLSNSNIIPNQEQDSTQDKILQVFTQSLRLGNKVFVMTTVRDQSTWLEIEKQKNLSQLKTIAFASAAHEFRNPLNAINSSLLIVESQVKNKEAKKYIMTAKNCSRLMLFLVNDILDFSQLESKKLVLNQEFVSLRKIAAECFSILKLKAEVKDLEFTYGFTEDFPHKVFTDPNRLSQILINLLSNSLKYTDQGYVKLFGSVNHQDKLLQLKVTDSGVGMDQDQQKKLFQAFTKIMNNRHMNKEGVGLGLTISKNLAKALGGDISVTSEVDKGSEFLLQLPYDADQEQSFYQQNSRLSNQSSLNDIQLRIQDCSESLSSIERNPKMLNLKKYVDNTAPLNAFFDQMQNSQRHKAQNKSSEESKKRGIRTGSTNLFNDLAESSSHSRIRKQSQAHNNQNSLKLLTNGAQFSQSSGHLSQQSIISKNNKIKNSTKQLQNTCECPRILIVDDDPFNLIALQGLLNQFDVDKVDQCYNGKQAIEKIIQNQEKICPNHKPYELIITDNQMPVMNGIEATIKLRKLQEQNQSYHFGRIVLLTGDEQMISNTQYQRLFDDIILKPIDSNNLGVLLMQTSSQSQF